MYMQRWRSRCSCRPSGPGLFTALGGGVMVLVFLALRATFAAVAVLLEPVFALVRLLLKLVLVFAVVVALVVLVGLGKLGGRGGDVGTAVPTGTPIGTPPAVPAAARHAGRRSPDEVAEDLLTRLGVLDGWRARVRSRAQALRVVLQSTSARRHHWR